jgi:hypothetical protein
MSVIFYCIADTAKYGDWGKKNPVTIEKHTFDWDDEEDREAVEEYIDDELTEENFAQACRNFLIECDIDWGQRGVSYVWLTQEQFDLVKKYK